MPMREIKEDRIFHIGDYVRIRTWKDMEKEFGLNDYNDINCKFTFTRGMREMGYCGTEFVITDITFDGKIKGHNCGASWISTDMLEHSADTVFDTEDIDNFLGSINVN